NGEDAEGEGNQIGGGTAAEHLEREYVWGPADAGFVELLVQYDSTGAMPGGPSWMPVATWSLRATSTAVGVGAPRATSASGPTMPTALSSAPTTCMRWPSPTSAIRASSSTASTSGS